LIALPLGATLASLMIDILYPVVRVDGRNGCGVFLLHRDHFNPLHFFGGEREPFGGEVFFHMLFTGRAGQRQHADLLGKAKNHLRRAGAESRHISLLERDGQPMRIIVPYERTRKVAVLTPRSEAEIAALKAQVGR
jgi:hypothetical protein